MTDNYTNGTDKAHIRCLDASTGSALILTHIFDNIGICCCCFHNYVKKMDIALRTFNQTKMVVTVEELLPCEGHESALSGFGH